MTDTIKAELQELVESAWRDANGDAVSAIRLVRQRTELGLREAARLVADVKHLDFVDHTQNGVKSK
jgi:hypothetical protein